MTISKKLFLMTALALNLGSLLNAYCYEPNQHIFDFAVTLSKQNNNNAKEISQWLFEQTAHNDFDTSKVLLILNAPLTLEEKTERLMQTKPGFIKKYTRKLNKNIISPIISKTSFAIKLAAIVAT